MIVTIAIYDHFHIVNPDIQMSALLSEYIEIDYFHISMSVYNSAHIFWDKILFKFANIIEPCLLTVENNAIYRLSTSPNALSSLKNEERA